MNLKSYNITLRNERNILTKAAQSTQVHIVNKCLSSHMLRFMITPYNTQLLR